MSDKLFGIVMVLALVLSGTLMLHDHLLNRPEPEAPPVLDLNGAEATYNAADGTEELAWKFLPDYGFCRVDEPQDTRCYEMLAVNISHDNKELHFLLIYEYGNVAVLIKHEPFLRHHFNPSKAKIFLLQNESIQLQGWGKEGLSKDNLPASAQERDVLSLLAIHHLSPEGVVDEKATQYLYFTRTDEKDPRSSIPRMMYLPLLEGATVHVEYVNPE